MIRELAYWFRIKWENRLVWWIIKLIPGEIKFWIMVRAAVRSAPEGAPGDMTYKNMHDTMVKERWFR
jgi:hypothetical protein